MIQWTLIQKAKYFWVTVPMVSPSDWAYRSARKIKAFHLLWKLPIVAFYFPRRAMTIERNGCTLYKKYSINRSPLKMRRVSWHCQGRGERRWAEFAHVPSKKNCFSGGATCSETHSERHDEYFLIDEVGLDPCFRNLS